MYMEVPCCFGLVHMARQAVQLSGKDIPFEEAIVSTEGDLILPFKTSENLLTKRKFRLIILCIP